ncbi:phospholipid-transporting ATPase IK [Discoglossus pictus]
MRPTQLEESDAVTTDTGLDCTWEVKANDKMFNRSFTKRTCLCVRKRKYADNSIQTSKYNILTFIPLNLYEQFQRTANLYFLFIIILQTVPAISTLPWFAVMMPLLFLLTIRGFRDLLADIARHKSDKTVNNRLCDILMGRSFSREKWKDIVVGDVIRLRKNEFVPADLLLLYSSEPNSLCYVETADIDGETNLKFKQALMVTHTRLCTTPLLAAFDGKVTCEEANSNMHSFVGMLEWNNEKYSLDNDRILLRGCKIRNTDTCYGLVIYAGIDSKIMKNSGKVTLKKSKLDIMMNILVVLVFGMLVACCLCLAIFSGVWTKWFQEKHHYVPPLPSGVTPTHRAVLNFFGFAILLSTLVPMSLYITLEFLHLVHSKFIDWDMEMYYAEKNCPAKARASSLNDLLGQVEYVFSDKTGTLTQNIMTFKKCCINSKVYDLFRKPHQRVLQEVSFSWNKYADRNFHFYDQSLIDKVCQKDDHLVKEFFRLLALCHTVMVDQHGGELVYQAASPDEEALVTAARNFGYVLISRTQDTITTSELGEKRTYKVLAMLDFSSVRKRMSILVRDPSGKIKLYTKGADDVILPRLHQSCDDINEHALQVFAEETLRTLCLAYKEVTDSQYTQWIKKYYTCSVSLQNRCESLDMVYEEMETGLELLGATAIEDKLQTGVPETIKLLKDGNMKVWMLTGDKQETAINVGFACNLLSDDMEILNESQICDILDSYWEHNNNSSTDEDLLPCNIFRRCRDSLRGRAIALVVNGNFLDRILGTRNNLNVKNSLLRRLADKLWSSMSNQKKDEETKKEWAFVDMASKCQAVICCRVAPKQKSLIVQLVKKHKHATTLAIGDGANDVNMIKTAHIGVGICGLEGTQAVQSSDYAVAHFCYLQRLLFIHGRWSYLRITKFLNYFFYKTFSSVLCHVWFACFSGFTALMVYDSWFIAFYAVLFTALPVLSIALLEQDVSAKMSLQRPELYIVGQSNSLFTFKTFFWSLFRGLITSLSTFFITFGAFWDNSCATGVCDYQSFAVIIATAGILVVTIEVTFEISYWTLPSVIAVFVSPIFYYLITLLTQTFPVLHGTTIQFRDVSKNTLNQWSTWLIVLLAVIISIIPTLIAHFVIKLHSQRNKFSANREADVNTVAMASSFKRGTHSRRSSYAFSHKEGYADIIISGTCPSKTTLKESNPPTPAASLHTCKL